MTLEVRVRQWGNSKAIILPKAFVEERQIEVGETLVIAPLRKANLKPIFGMLKTDVTAQQFKDEARRGWG